MSNLLEERRPYSVIFQVRTCKMLVGLSHLEKLFFFKVFSKLIGLSYLSRPDRSYSVITLEKFSCVASNTGKAGFLVQIFPTYLCITDVSLASLGVVHCVQYTCTHTLLGIVVDSITFTLLNNKYRVILILYIHINWIFT